MQVVLIAWFSLSLAASFMALSACIMAGRADAELPTQANRSPHPSAATVFARAVGHSSRSARFGPTFQYTSTGDRD